MGFSTKLRRLLADRRLSQEVLAARVGVSQNLVSRWACGKTSPKLEEVVKVAGAFGVGVAYLADDALDEPPAGLAPDEEMALDYYRDLRASLGQTRALKELLALAARAAAHPAALVPPDAGKGQGKGQKTG